MLAYTGSLQLLESGRTMALWRKGRLAKEGLSALDRAVSSAPHDVEVRFLRAISTAHLPGFFRREEQSAEELKWLHGQVQPAVANGQLDPRFGAVALLRYGMLLEKSSRQESQEVWRRAVKLAPESRAARDAVRRLER